MKFKFERHQKALDYAINQIKNSPISPFVESLYLYGSCSRGEEKWRSDVDLFLELKEEFVEHPELRTDLRLLMGTISSAELSDAEADLKVIIGKEWLASNSIFYKNVRRDGISLWN